MKIINIIIILMLLTTYAQAEFIPDTPKKENALLRAIFRAEGGRKASKPYGIMMKKCSWDNVAYCKLATQQTIRNNIKRWKKANDNRDYLTFLRDRYAPIKNATNDPKGLNNHWLPNVRAILKEYL
jgi:hypothetical protein